MARDDDEDDRPRKKRRRDEEDEDREDETDDESPEEEDGDDEEEPRSKRRDEDSADEEPAPEKAKGPKPMPAALVGALLVSFAWGFINLHSGCTHSVGSFFSIVQFHRIAGQRRNIPGFDQMEIMGMSATDTYARAAVEIFRLVTALALIAGGAALLGRKRLGKFIAIGAPVLMLLVELLGFALFLILSKGHFFVPYNIEFLSNMALNVAVAGALVFMLLNKDVNKALK